MEESIVGLGNWKPGAVRSIPVVDIHRTNSIEPCFPSSGDSYVVPQFQFLRLCFHSFQAAIKKPAQVKTNTHTMNELIVESRSITTEYIML